MLTKIHGKLVCMKLTLSLIEIIAIAAGFVVILILVGLYFSRVGKKELLQRLSALTSRLGEDIHLNEKAHLDTILTKLEIATDQAAAAVSEVSSDAIRMKRTLDRLPQGILLCDETGDILFKNVAAITLLSFSSTELVAANALDEVIKMSIANMGTAEKSLEIFGESRLTISFKCIPVDDGQRSLGYVVVLENTSEKKKLEDMRRDFVANVSHELKTPMSALGLLAETLADETNFDVIKKLAERIQIEAFRASRTIDDLLDLSRIEAEQSPQRDVVSLNLTVADSIERNRHLASNKQIELKYDEWLDSLNILGDRRQIVSAVSNLIENAIKYSEKGTTVQVNLIRQDENALIEIADSGIGIPERELERIFERFYRVDQARSRESGGTGLGLSIVRHVVQNHSGNISVKSMEGVGSTFTIVFPLFNPNDSSK